MTVKPINILHIEAAERKSSEFLGFGAEWDSRHYRDALTAENFALIRRRIEWMRLPVTLEVRAEWKRAGAA